MKFSRFGVIDLRQVILGFAVLCVMVTLGNQFIINYRVHGQQMVAHTLASNQAYASKLSDITEQFLNSLQMQLRYSAARLADNNTLKSQQQETLRLLEQTASFNSVVVVNEQGVITSTAPLTLGVKGVRLESDSAKQSLRAQAPTIPQPFVSPASNLIVSPSHPIFSADEQYQGYIAGTIYLHGDNILSRLLGQHFHNDKANIMVLSANGSVIYHSQHQRVGSKITPASPLWPAFTNAQMQSGSEGVGAMLVGYAPVRTANWVVLVGTERNQVVESVGNTIMNVLAKAAPVTVITLLVIWYLANLISAPLRQLAQRVADSSKEYDDVPTWFFEAKTLRNALRTYSNEQHQRINDLNKASLTDPLTGIGNRRYMEVFIQSMVADEQAFAVITLDIDHFKRVNDNYGHDVGDDVIQGLGQLLQSSCREYDGVCRSGGEEFLLILPGIGKDIALELAERLRVTIQAHDFTPVPQVTVSLGVSLWQPGCSVDAVLKAADNALYRAKQRGRNRCEVELLG
ncbi:putative diguanylate cyclase YdaM (plasmid) [Pseudoalteromonas sp. THAF3]|uniref:sensor domain-containing diguanylate cyclase n=1 Tax=Pseudoalteromonas sp. THAF3 TaxID=2587843 RepID=UPI001268E25C|nr:sensor domain-containing diguanylate cyclase [Pseudoalteromonas sp. THAF3]QFU06998.1 putative diguanylate cyclase YdaM [Pseudoalteromonas sp. THAF3]